MGFVHAFTFVSTEFASTQFHGEKIELEIEKREREKVSKKNNYHSN